jgi:formyltetrahydrofolate deformylase
MCALPQRSPLRNSVDELDLDVRVIVSDHPDLKGSADFYGVPSMTFP